jgi:polyisoprenoid-binding protein YceI
LETIVGTNAGVKGHFNFDPMNVKASSKGMFVIDVTKFRTGIDPRDEHFRDRFLHTKKFPEATFTLDKVLKASKKSIKSGESVELEIEGTMDMHGVKRKEKATVTVTYLDYEAAGGVLPGNVIAVKASFRVALADYNVERPEMLILKVGEVVDIRIASRLTDSPEMASGGCGGCGGGE